MELFILAHEYGHITAGHIGASPPSGGREAVLRFAWDQELEADRVGLYLSMHALRHDGVDVAHAAVGPVVTFLCHQLIDRTLGILAFNRVMEGVGSGSHPPATLRRQHVHEVLASFAPPDTLSSQAQYIASVDGAIGAMWKVVEPRLRAARAAGCAPDPHWSTQLYGLATLPDADATLL